jgi:hypothetical protein
MGEFLVVNFLKKGKYCQGMESRGIAFLGVDGETLHK